MDGDAASDTLSVPYCGRCSHGYADRALETIVHKTDKNNATIHDDDSNTGLVTAVLEVRHDRCTETQLVPGTVEVTN